MKFTNFLLPLLMVAPASAEAEHFSRRQLKGAKAGRDEYTVSTFDRIATFLVCSQLEPTCNIDTETVAEIVVASDDGMTLIYGDSENDSVGFVDITDPYNPLAAGAMDIGGETTSVAVVGKYVLAAINTSADFVNTSGELVVINMETMSEVTRIDLGGQPDAIAISKDYRYAAICIENERDEDLGDGAPPQAPAGFLVVLDLMGAPTDWVKTDIDLVGLDGVKFPDDPEPEYVSINEHNIAIVGLQENNALIEVDLATKMVIDSYSAGTVDLTDIDVTEEEIVTFTDSLSGVPREPDGVAWIDNQYFVTADEGDLDGGSRGFTVFDSYDNSVAYSSGNMLDHMAARLGHYPEHRSENKGNEPENVVVGTFDGDRLLFVISERTGLIFVFNINYPTSPKYVQALPSGVGPEGGFAIPSRGLFVAAAEVDDRGDKIRSSISIYSYGLGEPEYPFLISADREGSPGIPIPWAAISGLAAETRIYDYHMDDRLTKMPKMSKEPSEYDGDVTTKAPKQSKGVKGRNLKGNKGVVADDGATKLPKAAKGFKEEKEYKEEKEPKAAKFDKKRSSSEYILYAVEDSAYDKSRIFTIDTEEYPSVLTKETRIMDTMDVLKNMDTYGEFTADDLAALVNDDDTVNLDLEGIAVTHLDDGFWVVHEGRGTAGSAQRPVESLNMLIKVSSYGVIEKVVTLPDELNDAQYRYGFEGVVEPTGEFEGYVAITMQRAWPGDDHPRIAVYDIEDDEWMFFFYPLDPVESQNGGWVGLSDIASIGEAEFLVLERDNQAGPDAAIKRIYYIDLGEQEPGDVVDKTLAFDLLEPLEEITFDLILEKMEGLTIDNEGYVWVANDNDGTDDNNGYTVVGVPVSLDEIEDEFEL